MVAAAIATKGRACWFTMSEVCTRWTTFPDTPTPPDPVPRLTDLRAKCRQAARPGYAGGQIVAVRHGEIRHPGRGASHTARPVARSSLGHRRIPRQSERDTACA